MTEEYPDAMHIPAREWTYHEDWRCHVYRIGRAYVTLAPRNSYCDRGHWDGKVFGVEGIDWQDGFPRYYMNERRAKRELADWLAWRLKVETDSQIRGRRILNSRIAKTSRK